MILVIADSEKVGGRSYLQLAIDDFYSFTEAAGLLDPSFQRVSITWCNNQDSNHRIWSRFDRVQVNSSLQDIYSDFAVFHLPTLFSDHCPSHVVGYRSTKKFSSFKFLRMWLCHSSFYTVVANSWKILCGALMVL